jgi:hypothetical protein
VRAVKNYGEVLDRPVKDDKYRSFPLFYAGMTQKGIELNGLGRSTTTIVTPVYLKGIRKPQSNGKKPPEVDSVSSDVGWVGLYPGNV